ncbi:MAG: amino acid adenylation domain-containing protein [Candidatus Electrothrix gigas]
MTLEKYLPNIFSDKVDCIPDNIAVIYQTEQLTYQELNQRANQLAHHLLQQGVKPEQLVGLSIAPSLEMVVAIWGILKAGGAFVPLDPAYPADRLKVMIQDSQVELIVTTTSDISHLANQSVNLICLDELPTDTPLSNPQLSTISSSICSSNLAACLYTSGSTGKPKGVLIEHQALVNHCAAIQTVYQYDTHDRTFQFASLNHVDALEQIFVPLLNGAGIVIREPQVWNDFDFIAKIKKYGITVVDLLPEYWRLLLHSWATTPDLVTDLPLRLVILGGDVTTPETVELWKKIPALRSIRFINAYGMTEIPITSTYYEIPDNTSWSKVPIGSPVSNRTIYILDDQLQPVPHGEIGELHIGGTSLARGYLNQPELTKTKFIPDPFSQVNGARLYKTGDLARYLPEGMIEYRCRKDHQVQIRGFRVELGEVEAALLTHPMIKEAAVVAHGEGKSKRLMAYTVPEQLNAQVSSTTFKTEVQDYLTEKLPNYMIPDTVTLLETMPLTPSGKIDRQTLLVFGAQQRKLPLRLQISEYGSIDNLEFVPFEPGELAPDEVEIETQAASLNFRDVINVLGMLEEYNATHLGIGNASDLALGYECAGLVTRVGASVSNFQVGDEVIAYTLGSLATLVSVQAPFVVHKPKRLSFAEAASIPTVFLTVYYGLKELAKIKSGDRVLIHAAAGGVGQAAIQVAQQVGAEIFATASPGKWDYLKSQGVNRVMNSRTLDFASEIITADEKVDIVLNSLNGEFIDKSFEVLKEDGCFIELGKLGIWSQKQVTQRRPDVSYFPFDLGDIIEQSPDVAAKLMSDVLDGFATGQLRPLPMKQFSAAQVVEAFRYLSQARHIGKVVVSFEDKVDNSLSEIIASEVDTDVPVSLPQTSTERVVAALWCEILGLQQCDTQRNFFESGGNSLLALELSGRLGNALEISLPMQALLEHNTIELLARYADIRLSLQQNVTELSENEEDYEEGIL